MTIRYAWWGAEERAKRINKTIALFEKKYPKIKVKTDFQRLRGLLGEVPDPGLRWKSAGRIPECGRIPAEVRQEKRSAGPQAPGRRGQPEPGRTSAPASRRSARSTASCSAFPSAPTPCRWSSTRRSSRRPGSSPKQGWTWDEYFAGAEEDPRQARRCAGDTGYFGDHVPLRPLPAPERQGVLHRGRARFHRGRPDGVVDRTATSASRRGSSPTRRRSSRSSPSRPSGGGHAGGPSSPGTTSPSATPPRATARTASRRSPPPTARRPASTSAR